MILVLLGALTGAVVALEDEVSDPTAIVTGSMLSVTTDTSDLEFSEEGVADEPGWVGHGRGFMTNQVAEWSDPRLPSEIRSFGNFEAYGPAGYAVSSMWLLKGPDGYWEGPWTGFCDPEDHCHGMVVLTGHGAYEGLYAVLAARPDEDSSGTSSQLVEGAIYLRAMPPPPEPLEPTTE